jgi:hypothetical protein
MLSRPILNLLSAHAQVEQTLFLNQRRNVLKLLSCLTVVVHEAKEQDGGPTTSGGDGAPLAPFRPVRQNLGEVMFFVGASKAMRTLPLPPATLDPFVSLSTVLHKTLMVKRFGWRELTAWDWWCHIRENLHLLTSSGTDNVDRCTASHDVHSSVRIIILCVASRWHGGAEAHCRVLPAAARGKQERGCGCSAPGGLHSR